jgi:hypothetical protein
MQSRTHSSVPLAAHIFLEKQWKIKTQEDIPKVRTRRGTTKMKVGVTQKGGWDRTFSSYFPYHLVGIFASSYLNMAHFPSLFLLPHPPTPLPHPPAAEKPSPLSWLPAYISSSRWFTVIVPSSFHYIMDLGITSCRPFLSVLGACRCRSCHCWSSAEQHFPFLVVEGIEEEIGEINDPTRGYWAPFLELFWILSGVR